MSDEQKRSDLARGLRKAAEERLAQAKGLSGITQEKAVEDLLHELQVHQIELEMQNEELRSAQLAQEESYNRYAELYNIAPIGYFILSRHGRIASANLTGAALLGVPRKELIDQSFGRFVAPEAVHCWDRQRLDALKQEGTVSCELPLQRDDGALIYARLDSIRAVAEDGAFTLRTTVVDITESWRAKEALRTAETDYRVLFDRVPSGLYRSTPDGRFLAVNQALVDILGYSSVQELVNADVARMFYSTPEERRQWVNKLLQIGEFRNVEIRVLRKDGSPLVLLENSHVVRDEAGEILFFEGSLTDITDRKRAEEALRGSEENYRFMFDHNPQPMVIYDLETLAFLEVNQSAVEQYGYSREEFLSMTLRDIHPAEDIPILLEDIELARRSDNPTGEWRHFKKKGELSYVEIRSHSVHYHGRNARHILINDISERKRAEEALREERKLFMAGPTVVFRWQPGPPWQVTYASPNTKELLGYPAEAFTSGSLSFADIIHPDDVGRLAEEQRRFIRNERAYYEQEYRLRCSDGQFLWMHDFTRTVVINGSRQNHGYITDITERKRAEDAHRESERQYRQLIETMQDGVYRSSHEGRFLEVNPAMVKILGYDTVDELLAIDIPSQLYFALEDRQSAALKEKLEEMGVFRLRKKDGSEVWVEDHGRHVVAEDGTVLYHEGILRDITERRRAEEELRIAKIVVENSPTVVFRWLAEPGWPVEYVTENVTLFGFQPEELMHNKITFAEMVHPDDRERTSGEIDQHLLRGEDHYWLEYRLVSPKGETHWVDDHTTVIRDAAGQVLHYEGTVTDISERKKLEAEVERARMDFIFAVSHELKTPLLIMAATEEMVELLPAGQRGERFHEYSDVWKRNLIRLRTNIDNLVDSQRSPGTGTKLSLQSTDLGALIDRSLNDLAPLAEKKDLQVRRELDAVRPLFLDPEACIRIVTNLLTNAIKFSPPSALLRIELKEEEDQAVLRICDEGSGIPVEEMPNLFQPFRRGSGPVQAVVPGTGLGLYVSRILTEAQGGTIELESEVGRGTTAIIRFPLPAPERIH
ncbi:MAG: PAS domain S-box protein [bacterium]